MMYVNQYFYFFALVLVSAFHSQPTGAYRYELLHVQKGFRLENGVHNGTRHFTYNVRTKIDCSKRCLSLGPVRCISVNYSPANRTCEINDKTTYEDAFTLPVADKNWELFNTERALPKSCTYLRRFNATSGLYWVDPDGGGGVAAFEVYCDMSTTPPTVTFHHDYEDRTHVNGYENRRSYFISLMYNVSIRQIAAYVDVPVVNCSQHIMYECHGSIISTHAAWYDRRGQQAPFWAGGDPLGDPNNCACSKDGSCETDTKVCNCDKNTGPWTSDGGDITEPGYLPVTGVAFGDTGGQYEEGYHTIGPLVCHG